MNHTRRAILSFLALIFATSLTLHASEESTVILHIKGDRIQAGFAGESEPRVDMPAVVGVAGRTGPMIGMGGSQTYYGDAALKASGVKLVYPAKNAKITDWQNFEKLVAHVVRSKLGVEPDEATIVLNEPADNSSDARERTTRLFFESLSVQNFFMSPHFSSWAMTAELAGQASFVEAVITRDEYDEIGAEVIHRKSK